MYFGPGRRLIIKMEETPIELSSERIKQFHTVLDEKYYATDQHYEEIFNYILELETYLAKCDFNPTILTDSTNEKITICTQLRDCFEIGAKIALRLHHSSSFERWINIVLFIYMNYDGVLSESLETERIYALYLLKLLTMNNYNEYYCILERIPIKMIESGVLLTVPTSIHKCLVSLNFRHLYRILNDMKSDIDFIHFCAPILFITRSQQLTTIECAYSNVSVDDVARMLRFHDADSAGDFIKTQKDWLIGEDNKIDFHIIAESKLKAIVYSIENDLPQRACFHLNKPYERCPSCYKSVESVADRRTVDITMLIPQEYPFPIVKAIKDYGNFITVFDSLL